MEGDQPPQPTRLTTSRRPPDKNCNSVHYTDSPRDLTTHEIDIVGLVAFFLCLSLLSLSHRLLNKLNLDEIFRTNQ